MRKLWLVLVLLGLLSTVVFGVIPEEFNVQGRLLKSDGTPRTGKVNLTFQLYDLNEEIKYHEETLEVDLDSNGIFNAILGKTTPFITTNTPSEIAFSEQYKLKILEGTTIIGSQLINPVPSAITAKNVSGGGVVNAETAHLSNSSDTSMTLFV